ncbi:MAG: cupin domain-containing protein [Clostridia bacterium]|nr:cupin domain-containing protein [Clostridia bacterium]
MVRRKEECPVSVRENMRGGNGSVQITDFVNKAELYNSGRLFADITLAPGCGIGEHVHEGEEEIFVVTAGEVVYNDNGEEKVCKVGDVLICNDGEKHSIRNEGDVTASVTALIMLKPRIEEDEE